MYYPVLKGGIICQKFAIFILRNVHPRAIFRLKGRRSNVPDFCLYACMNEWIIILQTGQKGGRSDHPDDLPCLHRWRMADGWMDGFKPKRLALEKGGEGGREGEG